MAERNPVALFSCRCGAVRGRVADVSPRSVNRAGCYCDDCQAFAHRLGRADLLDARGRSDIVQVAPGSMRFEAGQEHIAGLRLSPKGLYRFYARCCNTPLGNTVGLKIPFVGLPASAFACEGQDPDRLFGPPRGAIMGQFAIGGTPPGTKGISLSLAVQAAGVLLGWLISGRASPNPLFDRKTREPLYPVSVLSREERDALRPLCGPNPA